jgi:hypothetical protein
MAGRLEQLRVVDPVLTTLARGYTNAEFVGDVLFPFVSVNKEAGKIPQFGKEAFKIYNTERAIRAKSNRISPEGITSIDYVCDEHDLEYPIDYREEDEMDIIDLEEHATMIVTEAIMLRHEKMCADLAQNANNYPAENKVTLSGISQWTDYTNSTPITDVEDAKEAIRKKIGKKPNVMIIGASTFKALKEHPTILEKIKYSMKGVVTVELLQEIFGIKKIAVGEAVYVDDAGNSYDVWSDNCILAYIPPVRSNNKRSPYEPSFAYTLRKKNKPEVDKRDEDGKIRLIRNTDIFVPKIVGADAGFLIADTNA